MRHLPILVVVTLSWLAAGCDASSSSVDAAPASDSAPTFDSSSGVADAAPGDAAPADAAPEQGVRCGPDQTLCDPVATAGCCDDPKAGESCLPIGKVSCFGRLTRCDGVEDCMTAGDVCCSLDGSAPDCAAAESCTAASGSVILCHFDQECAAEAPHCCAGTCQVACE